MYIRNEIFGWLHFDIMGGLKHCLRKVAKPVEKAVKAVSPVVKVGEKVAKAVAPVCPTVANAVDTIRPVAHTTKAVAKAMHPSGK